MSQVTNATWDALNKAASKSVEFLIAIGGWSTVYSVGGSYSLADMTSGLNDKLSQFTSIQQLASVPSGSGSKCKGRPEEGATTIDQMTVAILDKRLVNARVGTDLASRQAYLEGSSSGFSTTLQTTLTPAATIVTLKDGTNFAALSVCYLGVECVKLGDKVVNGDGTSTYGAVTPCVRGYRLTQAKSHVGFDAVNNILGVKVYSFLPSLYRRPLVVYKGFQSFSDTSKFVRAFSGLVTNDQKSGATLTITANGMTWDLYGDQDRMLTRIVTDAGNDAYGYGVATPIPYLVSTLNPDDQIMLIEFGKPSGQGTLGPYGFFFADPPAQVSGGHYAVVIGSEVVGIKSLYQKIPNFSGLGGDLYEFNVRRGVGGSPVATETPSFSSPVSGKLAFTNMDFSQSQQTGTEPITLLLQLLTSDAGDGSNGTYDVFPKGIGLAIPQSSINIASFTAIQALPDYDSDQRVFFVWEEPTPALDFVEKQLCAPFGWYLMTGADGRINLVRPRNPTSLRIAAPNNLLRVAYPAGGQSYQTTLATGVYRPTDACIQIAAALNALGLSGATWTCSFDQTARKFTVAKGGNSFDFALASSTSRISLGFTAQQLATVSAVSDTAVLTNPTTVITENDVWAVEEVENRDYQITSVTYKTNYTLAIHDFTRELYYIDAEQVNLGDALGVRNYALECKGLIASHQGHGHAPLGLASVWMSQDDATGSAAGAYNLCTLVLKPPPPQHGIDKADGWASLFSLMLLDRYKSPPMMLKARLKWRWSTIELGDQVRMSHAAIALVIDREMNSDLTAARNLEVVAIKPSVGNYVEVTFLGFRDYPL